MVELDVDTAGKEDIPAPLKETIYRIAQEQLNNIEKYAMASEVKVHLHASPCLLRLVIEDNGKGFDPAEGRTEGHHGLANLQSRAEALGGSLEVKSKPGAGTEVQAHIPVTDGHVD